MKTGIALPLETFELDGEGLLEWIRRIEGSRFETIAVTDEIVSPMFESLSTLAAAAALTRDVQLMTTVIAGPTRDTAILAKQAASIDALSGGRLSLGLGVGELVEDFNVVGVDMRTRGKRFDEQLSMLKRIWSGDPMGESGRSIGPPPVRPGGPELLIGGWAPPAVNRIGRFADGLVDAVLSADMLSDRTYRLAEQSWKEHQRSGKPRFVNNVYFALGPEAQDGIESHLRKSYAGTQEYDLEKMRTVISATDAAIREMVQRLASIGVDELIFHPVSPRLDQVDRLEHALG
jgi:alkanesulfonate monooxygenase SsuD/methylene tetrahydromethanopterin reductase-like flavin-dependent oxidoreductase (luciferase family)